MAAQYPSGVRIFPTRLPGERVRASHINDLQDELQAVITALIQTGLAHDLWPQGSRDLGLTTHRWRDGWLDRHLTVGGNTTIGGTATIGDACTVTGAMSLGSTLDVTGATTLGDTVVVSGLTTCEAGAVVHGNAGVTARRYRYEARSTADLPALQAGSGEAVVVYHQEADRLEWSRNGSGFTPVVVPVVDRIHTQDGTSSATTPTLLDSVALTGLHLRDRLWVQILLEVSGQDAQRPQLMHVTDNLEICTLNDQDGIGNFTTARAALIEDVLVAPKVTTATDLMANGRGFFQNNTFLAIGGRRAVTTPWTSDWTLGLRFLGLVASGGTLAWRWTVYRIRGA